MDGKDRRMLMKRLERIESAVAEMKAMLAASPRPGASDGRQRAGTAPGDDTVDYVAEWLLLKSSLMIAGSPEEVLGRYLSGKTKQQVRELIQQNNLPVDPKASKPEQTRQFARLVAVSRTIQRSRAGQSL